MLDKWIEKIRKCELLPELDLKHVIPFNCVGERLNHMEVLLVMWRRAIKAVAARLPVDVGVRVSQQLRAPFAPRKQGSPPWPVKFNPSKTRI